MITLTESPSGGQLQIKEEGSDLGVASVLNFTGACIDATYSGSTVTLNVKKLLGWLNLSAALPYLNITKSPDNVRSIQNGYTLNETNTSVTWSSPLTYGDLSASSFNTSTGIWTTPVDGYYSFTIFSGLAMNKKPADDLRSSEYNSDGCFGVILIGSDAYPKNTFNFGTEPTLNFDDYIGHYTIGLTTLDGSRIITSNTQYAYYNTSQFFITATAENVYLEQGTQLVCRYLNKCKYSLKGAEGNSFHFSVIHLK